MTKVRFPDLLGQDLALHLLSASLERDRVATAYGFFGPWGVGRSLAAQWFAQALLCSKQEDVIPCGTCLDCRLTQQKQHPDLLWIEPTYLHQGQLLTVAEAKEQQIQRRGSPQIRIEQIQKVVTFAARVPLRSAHAVIILEGAESLTESTANALLKTLEEPGKATLILLAPTAAHLLTTLVSRCQAIPFYRLSRSNLEKVLQRLNLASDFPASLLSVAQGSPGLALEALDYWHQIPPDLIQDAQVRPSSIAQALALGRRIAKTLDLPTQLWLVTYLQHLFWDQGQSQTVRQLEQIRTHLLSFVQPQLAWEVHLGSHLLPKDPEWA
jgi:DNA polymerase-3 subunit delta'